MMSTRMVVVAPDAPVASALAWASLHEAEHVVVVADHDILGVASTRELNRADPEQNVAGCLGAPAPCIEPGATLPAAAALMEAWQVTALPVAASGELLGVVTAEAVYRDLEAAREPGPRCLNCSGREDVARDDELGIHLCRACRRQILWRSSGASG